MRGRLRVAMAGAGFASGLHLPGWKRLPNVELVGICDPDQVRATGRASEYAVAAVFSDAATMLDALKPDVLDIVAPLNEHVSLCELAAERGIAILCQKPLAPSVAQARKLADLVQGRVRLMVHENWRFRPHYRQVKAWLDAGDLGAPVSCVLQVHSSGLLGNEDGVLPQLVRQPFFSALERLLIGEVLIHHLDVLRWLLGPLAVVTARTGRLCTVVRGEDHAALFLQGRECWAALEGSLVVPGAPPTPSDRLHLTGTRGTVLLEATTLRLKGAQNRSMHFDQDEGYRASYAAAIAHFVSALSTDSEFETDVGDNIQTLQLVEQAYAAAGWPHENHAIQPS